MEIEIKVSISGHAKDFIGRVRTAVDDTRTRLVILLLRDPQVLESGERGQDGTTYPDGVFTLGRGHDLYLRTHRSIYRHLAHGKQRRGTNLHAGRGERREFPLHTV